MQTVGLLDRLDPRNELILSGDLQRSVLSSIRRRSIVPGPFMRSRQLLNIRADLGLILLSPKPETDLTDPLITEIQAVAVVSLENPLAKLPPLFLKEAMRDHLKFVVSEPGKRLFCMSSPLVQYH